MINSITFFVYMVDKLNAKKKLRRVSEKNLILLAVAGGSAGALFAMYLLRHKTKHLSFTVSVPIILILQAVCLWFVFFGKLF